LLRLELKSRIERLTGTKVESYRRVEGGYTPALRLLCKTTQASVFVKIGTTPLTSKNLNREIRIYNCLSGNFMPHLVAWERRESICPSMLAGPSVAENYDGSWKLYIAL